VNEEAAGRVSRRPGEQGGGGSSEDGGGGSGSVCTRDLAVRENGVGANEKLKKGSRRCQKLPIFVI
jgi:hypothetical protein